jgi:hypothetical protein
MLWSLDAEAIGYHLGELIGAGTLGFFLGGGIALTRNSLVRAHSCRKSRIADAFGRPFKSRPAPHEDHLNRFLDAGKGAPTPHFDALKRDRHLRWAQVEYRLSFVAWCVSAAGLTAAAIYYDGANVWHALLSLHDPYVAPAPADPTSDSTSHEVWHRYPTPAPAPAPEPTRVSTPNHPAEAAAIRFRCYIVDQRGNKLVYGFRVDAADTVTELSFSRNGEAKTVAAGNSPYWSVVGNADQRRTTLLSQADPGWAIVYVWAPDSPDGSAATLWHGKNPIGVGVCGKEDAPVPAPGAPDETHPGVVPISIADHQIFLEVTRGDGVVDLAVDRRPTGRLRSGG